MTETIAQQFAFLTEIEKLRGVTRHNLILDGSRPENSAEHSWHLALYALAFAPHAPDGVDIDRVIGMLLLHDIVEVDVGDHPIHEEINWDAVAAAETVAADRLFGLLPESSAMRALWQEFEDNETQDARFAKVLDRFQPLMQTLCGAPRPPLHLEICHENLTTGRAAMIKRFWPTAHAAAMEMLETREVSMPEDFARPLAFVNEADRLKRVLRASKLGSGSRHENSSEHSWHIMMFAWVLVEHAPSKVDIQRVLRMLLLHDLVEIDAGDMPIHKQLTEAEQAAIEAQELAAAERIFGLLPQEQAAEFMAIWTEFEAAETPEAIYAKAIDRVQPVLLNLMNGGGSWVDYDVHMSQIDTRVGQKVERGAPAVWDYMRAQMLPWFAAQGRA